MRFRAPAIFLCALTVALCLAASAGASLIGIYRNDMESSGRRAEVAKLMGDRCGRGGSDHAFRIVVGKATKKCTYRVPVVGRDLQISTVARLLSRTPKAVQRKAFLALNLRAGGAGAGYELAVFPLQRKVQLRKILPDGSIKYLHIEKKVRAVKGTNRANKLRLRAFNVTRGAEKGTCRILAFVGSTQVANVTDEAAGELQGRAVGFSTGATGNAKGLVASADDVVVRVPNPF